MIYMWFTGLNYYKLVVKKDCDSIFTTLRLYGNQVEYKNKHLLLFRKGIGKHCIRFGPIVNG
jgi:hypothetical protein